MGQPLPIFVTERHPPWKLATSYLVAQGEFCCHPLLFYLDPYLLFPPKGRRRNLGLLKSRPFALCRSMSLLSPRCWFFRTLWIRVSRALGVNRSCLYRKEIFSLVASRLSCALVFNWWNEIGNLGITSPINGLHQIALNSMILFISSQIRINFFGLNIK